MMASPVRCLISAGPTREYFDPVRFLSNPSSGKMGYALAAAAAARGWQTTLVSGPTCLDCPPSVDRVSVETGTEMFAALDARFDACTLLIMTAAVMDYRPVERAPLKVKKDQLARSVAMEPTVDILKTLAARKQHQLVVGFAAETDHVEAHAREKLIRKRCDYLVANQVGQPGAGFASDTNEVTLLASNGSREPLGPASKTELAHALIARFAAALDAPAPS